MLFVWGSNSVVCDSIPHCLQGHRLVGALQSDTSSYNVLAVSPVTLKATGYGKEH